jgi:hypothetical protein
LLAIYTRQCLIDSLFHPCPLLAAGRGISRPGVARKVIVQASPREVGEGLSSRPAVLLGDLLSATKMLNHVFYRDAPKL